MKRLLCMMLILSTLLAACGFRNDYNNPDEVNNPSAQPELVTQNEAYYLIKSFDQSKKSYKVKSFDNLLNVSNEVNHVTAYYDKNILRGFILDIDGKKYKDNLSYYINTAMVICVEKRFDYKKPIKKGKSKVNKTVGTFVNKGNYWYRYGADSKVTPLNPSDRIIDIYNKYKLELSQK